MQLTTGETMRITLFLRVTAIVLAMPLLFAGCAARRHEQVSQRADRALTQDLPSEAAAAAGRSGTSGTGAQPASGQAVEYRLDEDATLSYSRPEGIDGIFVPAFVFEPAVATIFPGAYYLALPSSSPPRTPTQRGTLRAGEDWYVRTFGDNYTATASANVEAWSDKILIQNVQIGGTFTVGNTSGSTGCN